MVEWILILTLVQGHSYGGSAVTSVPGFESRAACLNAGNEWLRQARKSKLLGYTPPTASALCVRRK